MNTFEFLKEFPKGADDLYIVYDLFTFDNLFRLILNEGLSHDEVMDFMIANCSFSAHVFQERIHNKKFKSLNTKNMLSAFEGSSKAKFIADILSFL